MATWRLDAAGVPIEYEGLGNDYMKAALGETFTLKNGKAHWKNRSEQGEQSVTGEAFYVPVNAPPEFTGALARALLKAPGHKLRLASSWRSKSRGVRQAQCQRRQSRNNSVPHSWPFFHTADDLAQSQRRHGGKRVELVLCRSSSIRRGNT